MAQPAPHQAITANWQRVARALRPAEWVVALFALYLGLALAEAARGGIVTDTSPAEPRLDFICAALSVIAVEQVLRYARTPWPEDSEFVRVHWMLLPFTGIGLVLQVVAVARLGDWGYAGLTVAKSVHVLFALLWLFRRFATCCLPFLLLWLALGVHIKRHGRVQGRVFLREAARGAFEVARDWAPPMLLVLVYGSLGDVLDRQLYPDIDVQLRGFDTWLMAGHNPVQALQAIVTPALSEWMVFCYSFYAVLYPLGLGVAYAQDRASFRRLAFMVTLTLAAGYATYTFMPAVGPAFTEKFSVDLHAYYFGWMKDELMDKYRVPRDCFPSLHTAISLVFLFHAYRYTRRLFWFLLPIVVSIPLACLYLRYHYLADVLAGGVLAVAVWVLTPKIQGWYERARPAVAPAEVPAVT